VLVHAWNEASCWCSRGAACVSEPRCHQRRLRPGTPPPPTRHCCCPRDPCRTPSTASPHTRVRLASRSTLGMVCVRAVWCGVVLSMWCRSVVTKEIVNVEVAPFKNHSILNVTGGYSYHMNEVGWDVWHARGAHAVQYLRLNVSQFPDNSSTHRLARVREMPEPSSVQGGLCCATVDKESRGGRDPEHPWGHGGCAVPDLPRWGGAG
jgi:hypothetical protein